MQKFRGNSHPKPMMYAATLLAVMLLSLPTTADAWEGQLWTGVGASNTVSPAPGALGRWGPAAHLGANLQIGDFWKVGLDLGASFHPALQDGEERFDALLVTSVALEARYALDVFTYIPYVGLAGVVYPSGPTSERSPEGESLGIRATIGADYRQTRTRSLGVALDIHAPMTSPQTFPLYGSARVYLAWHFRSF